MKEKKIKQCLDDQIKALHISGRQDQFERNGGGQWVAVNRPHKNKKKYNRKDSKKEVRDLLPFLYFLTFKICLY